MRRFLLVCGLVSFLPLAGALVDKKETKKVGTQGASSNNSLKNQAFKPIPLDTFLTADHHQGFRQMPYGGMEEQDLLHARPSSALEVQEEETASSWGEEEGASRSVAQEADDGVEKISVTGSRIKRTDTEGASPLLVIDKEQIEQSGYNSLSDILRDMPLAAAGAQRESSLESDSTITGITLRGSKDVLVLMNGSRMAPYKGMKKVVDFNSIPVSIIERVEILKDSASAVYGADAVGGVVNIITKRDYSGGQVSVSGSLIQRQEGNQASSFASFFDFSNWNRDPKDKYDEAWKGKGDKLNIEASYGGSTGEWDYMTGVRFRFNAPLYMKDREFARVSDKNYYSKNTPFGNWSQDGGDTLHAGSHCPKEITKDRKGNTCGFDYSAYMQVTPLILQGSGFFQAGRDMGPTSLFTTALYSYTRAATVLAPAPDDFSDETKEGGRDWRIPVSIAKSWGLPVNEGGEKVTVLYRPLYEKGSGLRKGISNNHFYQVQTFLEYPFEDTLELDTTFNVSGYHSFKKAKGFLNKEKLYNMALAGDFNPFLPKDKKNDISDASFVPTNNTHSLLVNVEPQLTGELATLWGEPVNFSLGNLDAWQMYSDSVDKTTEDKKVWGGNDSSAGKGSRFFSAFYGELSTIQARDMLELHVAARTDVYSDFGWTKVDITENMDLPFSPSAKLTFQPLKGLKFRTSWGLGFKVPTLGELYHGEDVGYPFGRDYMKCEEEYSCPVDQYKTKIFSNEDLKPETFQSVNFGVVAQPVGNLSFSMDYYLTNQKNTILTPQPTEIFEYGKDKGIQAVQKLRLDVKRNESTPEKLGSVRFIETRPINSGRYKVRGLDSQGSWVLDNVMNEWNIVLGGGYTYMLYLESQIFKNGGRIKTPIPYPRWAEWIASQFGGSLNPKERTKDTHDGYPRWRNRTSLAFVSKDKKYQFALVAHNIPGQLRREHYGTTAGIKYGKKKAKENEEEFEGLKNEYYVQLDLMAAVTFGKQHNLTVGIKNVLGLDRPPTITKGIAESSSRPIGPNYSSTSTLNSSLYSPYGREVDVRYTYNF